MLDIILYAGDNSKVTDIAYSAFTQAEQPGVQIPARAIDPSFAQIVQTECQSHPASYSVGTEAQS
jgi:hypothetical protein